MEKVRFTRFAVCVLLAAAGIGSRAEAAEGAVVLNEINCEGTDWVELVNTGPTATDISGWLLTDDPLDSTRADHRYLFGDSTTIAAGGNLVVERSVSGSPGFPFGISCGGDTIRLADAGVALTDEIAVPCAHRRRRHLGPLSQRQRRLDRDRAHQGRPRTSPRRAAATPTPPHGCSSPTWWWRSTSTCRRLRSTASTPTPTPTNPAPSRSRPPVASYGPLNIGIRLKGGAGSFRPLSGKAAFKLKFDEFGGPRFLGLKRLTLNNMVQDKSMIHEVLAYEAFRAAGIDAPRTGYANVRLNEDDYGVYLNVETPDAVAIQRWFESTQHLYEGEYGVDVVPESVGDFEVDEGSESDRSDLEDHDRGGVRGRAARLLRPRRRPGRPSRDDQDVGGRAIHRPLGRLLRPVHQ